MDLFQKAPTIVRGLRTSSMSPTPKTAALKANGNLWFKQVNESLFKSVVSQNSMKKMPEKNKTRNINKNGGPNRCVDLRTGKTLQQIREKNEALKVLRG